MDRRRVSKKEESKHDLNLQSECDTNNCAYENGDLQVLHRSVEVM